MPSLSFVIPVRNDALNLDRCLASIRRTATTDDVEIVVVDNGSEDDSRMVAVRHGARALSLPGLRVSELRNRGVAASRGSVIAFVDADHEIVPGWVSAALARLEEPLVGAVGAPYSPPPDGTWVQRAYDRLREHGGVRDVEWLGSGNLAIRRDVFEACGGFDATLEACEDVDFCARLRRAGFRIVADPALESVHFGDPETLAGLLRSELWRARGNLRVTFRSGLTWRSAAGLAITAANLAALMAIVVAAMTRRADVVLAAIAAVGGLAALRAGMLLRGDRPAPRLVARLFGIALAYHLGRAIALVWTAPHRRRSLSARRAAAKEAA
jgi:glycosyltransferase involved in cell wall biosynthesis